MSEASSRSFLILLVVLSMLGPLTLNILSPSIPGLAAVFDTSKEMSQLTLSSYLFGMAVSQLLLGPLADRFGRRPVLLVALGTYVAASCAAASAGSIEVLVVARTIQSFGATAGLTLGRTIIRDVYDRDAAASMIGYVTMGMMVAPMVAPLIGAKIDETYGWQAIMAYCAILGVLSLGLASARLTETRPPALVAATTRQVLERSLALLGNARFMAFWGASSFCSALFFAFIGTAPYLVIDHMGYSKTAYGYWFMILSTGYVIGNYLSGRLSRSRGIDRLIIWGNLAGLVGAVAILVPGLLGIEHPLALFLPAMIISFGNGMVIPNAIAGALSVDPKAAGAGSGLMGFGQVGVGAVVSYFAAKHAQSSVVPLALMMLACAILAYLSGWLSRRPVASQSELA